MNERIRKLIEEVVHIEIDPDSKMETIYTCGPEDFEVFAELIVRECIDIVYQQERVPKEYFYSKPAHQHELAIKQHFGVE